MFTKNICKKEGIKEKTVMRYLVNGISQNIFILKNKNNIKNY